MACPQFFLNIFHNWNLYDQNSKRKLINPFTHRSIEFFKKTFDHLRLQCLQNAHGQPGMIHNVAAFTCYMDVILYCLFALPNEWITQQFITPSITTSSSITCHPTNPQRNLRGTIRIQDELRKLSLALQSHLISPSIYPHPITIQPLLRILQRYCSEGLRTSTYEQFYLPVQRDCKDFLNFLFHVFSFQDSHPGTFKESIYYQTNTTDPRLYLSFVQKNTFQSIFNIPSEALLTRSAKKPLSIQTLLRLHLQDVLSQPFLLNGIPMHIKHVKRQITKFPPFFVIDISRIDPLTQTFIELPILPRSHLGTKPHHQLSSIIIQIGDSIQNGHYIAFVKWKHDWYLFDDLATSIEKIGSFQNLISYNKRLVCKRSTLLFYMKC